MIRWSLPVLILALAAPAAAQQWQVDRDQFAFAGRQLTVHLDVEGDGTLRVIRGSAGLVRVSSRADEGIAAAGLTADEHLTLSSSGPGPIEYVIVVPERVRLTIHMPGTAGVEAMGGHDRSRTFHWSTVPHEEPDVPISAPEPDRGRDMGSAFTVFTAPFAPATVALPDLRNVRSVTVRVEGSIFRVGASRPLALSRGDPTYLEIRPANPPMEIIVVVPMDTRSFTISAGGAPALIVDAEHVSVLCSPSTRQWLSGGRGWVTFTPTGGVLRCDAGARRAAHET